MLNLKQMLSHYKTCVRKDTPLRLPLILASACAFFVLYLCVYTTRFFIAIYRIDFSQLPHSILFHGIMLILPVLLWAMCTCADFFNYHRFKITAYVIAAYSETILITSIIFQLLSRLFLPSILSIRTDEIFTK